MYLNSIVDFSATTDYETLFFIRKTKQYHGKMSGLQKATTFMLYNNNPVTIIIKVTSLLIRTYKLVIPYLLL